MNNCKYDASSDVVDLEKDGIQLQGYFRRFGNNAASKIPLLEFIGDSGEYLKLGQYLTKFSLTKNSKSVVIRLTRNSEASINAIIVVYSSVAPAILNGMEINSISYIPQPCPSIVTELPSNLLPWFGFLDHRKLSQDRKNYALPSWAKSVVVLQGCNLSHLALAKYLMDLGNERTAGFEGFCLTHQDRSVCSGSYEAGFWLSGSEYDQFKYPEYFE